ncbi:hypothetical protein J4E81_002881 [Alternaria sp. BMP 2799]|nr:hypothetical protein J4E81_002881 [Alternaria sp. BMP 2799]
MTYLSTINYYREKVISRISFKRSTKAMEYFSGVMRFLHKSNKTPKPKETIRFEVKLLELQSFVDSYVPKTNDSHSPEAEDSHAPEAEDSQASEAKDSPQLSAEDTRRVQVKTDLEKMSK